MEFKYFDEYIYRLKQITPYNFVKKEDNTHYKEYITIDYGTLKKNVIKEVINSISNSQNNSIFIFSKFIFNEIESAKVEVEFQYKNRVNTYSLNGEKLFEVVNYDKYEYEITIHYLNELKTELENILKDYLAPETIEDKEPINEIEFNGAAPKIAWLFELGIVDLIINQCKDGDTNNYGNAGKIIASFTDIHPETARKCLSAIYNKEKKNNPLNNHDNILEAKLLAKKYKLNKGNIE